MSLGSPYLDSLQIKLCLPWVSTAWVWRNEQGSGSITKRKFPTVNNNWPKQHFRCWAQSPRIQCKAGRHLNFKWLTSWSLLFLFLHLHCSSQNAAFCLFTSTSSSMRNRLLRTEKPGALSGPENTAGTQGSAAATEPALLTFPISTALVAWLGPAPQPGN